MTTENKKALVFGGGGSKGSYAVGVCQALSKTDLSFDIVTGTSIGAFLGAMYVTRSVPDMEVWEKQFSAEKVARNLFEFPNRNAMLGQHDNNFEQFAEIFTKNGPSVEPMRQSFTHLFSFDRFKNSEIDFACLSWNVSRCEPAPFFKKDLNSLDETLDALCASAAYFPGFDLVKIGQDYYADGGYHFTIPWKLASDMGAESMVIISLQNPDEEEKLPDFPVELLFRPILKLSYFLDMQSSHMVRQIHQGYLEGLKYLDLAPGYLYTFYPDDWPFIEKIENYASMLMEKSGLKLTQEILTKMLTGLLGYEPYLLKNKYMDRYLAGQILEALALTAGLDLYVQYHYGDFLRQLENRLTNFHLDLNMTPAPKLYENMKDTGINDLIIFFHNGMSVFGGKLPEQFGIFKQNFVLPYYLGLAWYLMDQFFLQPDLSVRTHQ